MIELNLYAVITEGVDTKVRARFLVAADTPSAAVELVFLKLDQTEGVENKVVNVEEMEFKVITPDESL